MPFINARLNLTLSQTQKDELQIKLSNAVSSAFRKPQAYIMSEIADNCSLYMGGKAVDKGAYISVSLLGSASKQACSDLTQSICNILAEEYGINGANVYVTYHPVDLWGWNGQMF